MRAKTEMMTERERIQALLRREKPDRVPLWPFASGGFCVTYTKTPIADAYNKPEVALDAQRRTCRDFGWVFTPMLGYAAFGGWEFGGEVKWPAGEFSQAPTVTRCPVEKLEDVWTLKVPDVRGAGIVPIQTTFSRLSSQERLVNEPFNVTFSVGGPFTMGSNVAGTENLCRWVLKKPEAAHRLLRLTTDFMMDLAEYWKDAFGIEGVLPRSGEPTSSNQILSPTHFEAFVLPYMREVHEKILLLGYKHIYTHICGDHNKNLPFWAQIPFGDPGIISIGHEVPLETAARYFPSHIILGNLETTVIQTGTPEEVYEATKGVLEKGKRIPGGYIFSPGCDLPPAAPPDNVRAMTDAVNEFGWYD